MLGTIFFIAAVVGGTVMVCQFALTLLGLSHEGADGGLGHHGDLAGDAHAGGDFHAGHLPSDHGEIADSGVAGDHHTDWSTAASDTVHPDSSWLFGIITFRGLVAGGAFFGLAGMASLRAGHSEGVAVVLALAAGVAAMYGMYWSMRALASLASSGNERIGNAVGRCATVYVPVPGNRQGAGKVQLSMQNRIVEYQAVTDESDRLKTGETVEIVAVAGSDTLHVRRVAEPAAV